MRKIVSLLILLMIVILIMPVDALQNKDEKISVLINFKEKADAGLVREYGGDIKYNYTFIPIIAAELTQDAIDALSQNPSIDFIEPDGQAQIPKDYNDDLILDEVLADEIPWGISRINATAAQELGFKGSGIKIAVIDSGIDYTHPDLKANYLGGYDFYNGDSDPMDDHSHGTHVSGIIAAPINGIGVVGVAPEAKIYGLKVFGSTLPRDNTSYSNIMAAIEWAVNNDADIITMSLSGPLYSSSLKAMCDYAYNKGIVLVGSAGNTAGYVRYPAAYDSVIAVSGIDSSNKIASWSCYGPEVDFTAPGVNVKSTIPDSSYGYKDGTSMSTPHVTGAIALLLSTDVSGTPYDLNKNGKWDPAEVYSRLRSTAIDLGTTGKDNYYGYGLIDAYAAVKVFSPTTVSSTAVYNAVYENRIRQTSPTTVYSTSTYIDVGKITSSCRDLMLFDLSSYKTTDKISKATLSLYWYFPAGSTRTSDTVLEVYRPVEWDQKYVSWNYRTSGTLWSTAGGNWYDKNGAAQGSTPYTSLTFAGSKVPDNKYYDFDVTQLVQEYVSGKYKNTGFFLKAKTESGDYIAFYSSEYSNTAMRPKLTITSASGSTSTDTASPVANAGADKIAPTGSVVTFDGSASTDDKGIASYSWDFDVSNGIASEATGVTATHTYTSPGTYTVTLTVTDTAGKKATDTLKVVVSSSVDNAPVANAGADKTATTGSAVTFSGSASTDDKGIASYSWDFDISNGITSEASGVIATHTYTSAGTYTVTLTVTDTAGHKSSDTLQVVVSKPASSTTSISTSYSAVYDNRMASSSPTTVYSSLTYLDVGKSSINCRDVMLFDLSSYKTTDTISKATLSLYWYYPASKTRTSNTVVDVYRPVEWDPKYVTWNSRMSGVLWSTAGGNWYDMNGVAQGSTPYASLTFAGSKVADSKYYDFDVTQLVQEYVSGKYKNTGFFLKARMEGGNYIAFYSSDYSKTAMRPKLTVTSISGSTSTDIVPVANAGADKTATTGSVVTFDGSASTDDKGIVSYSWDFDVSNGITSEATGVMATHTYTSPGTYTVTLTVTDTAGQKDTDTLKMIVSSPVDNFPVANAGADKTATTSSVVTFSGSGSTDDKGIVSYSWDFDASNGITSEASGVTATHTYTSPGTYTVTLTVTDTAGQKSTDTLKVIVSSSVDNPPVANAGADKTATTGSVVTFSGSGSTDDKGIASYSWDFDVSNSITSEATGVTVTHTYTSPGTYTVTLTVTDTAGQKSTDALKVIVSSSVDNPPVADAGADQNVTVGSAISFDGSASGDDKGIASYSWDFDMSNGITSEASGVTATHTYAFPGTYTVTLTVTDTAGQKSTDTLKVIVSGSTDSVIYSPLYDNRLRESLPNSVLSASTYLDIGRSTSLCRDVMLFDLRGYNATDKISKATLSLYWYYPAGKIRNSDTVVEIYRPVEWNPNYVSWNYRASGILWSTAGGNWYDKNNDSQGSIPYASVIFPASTVPDNRYYDFDVTQLVQEYINGTYENTGFFLKAKTENENYIAFYSSEWSTGAQKPKLTITSASSSNSTDVAPVAYAGVDQNATVGSVVSFNGSGSTDDVGITSYSWDFNAADGITSEAGSMTATHVYASAGTYTVTLKVTDTKGQTSTDTLTVFVSVPLPLDASPVAYAGVDQNATVGSVVSFNGSGSTDDVGITSYSWDFNAADGITSEASSMTASHVYASAGNYTVTLTVTDNKGQTSTDTLTVFVSVPLPPDASPVAYAGPDQNATVGSVVSFNGSGSTDDVDITSYSWDFNAADGITSEASSMTATHVYTSAGNYTVTLTVADNKGQTSSDTLTVFVSVPLPPDASPVAYAGVDQNVTVGSVVSFNGSGSTDDVGITSYSWDFNAADGITSEASSMTATHVYASAGNYTVTLTVADNKGQTSTDTLTVFVSVPLPPDASPVAYAGPDQNATVGSVVSFNGRGSTDDVGITSYSWDFNAADGITSEATSMTATHVYASAGNYTVTLTVADNKGQTSTDTLTVFVSVPLPPDASPVAYAGPDQNATVGSVVNFNGSGSTDDVGITSYSWDFNAADGISSEATSMTATHVYTSAGNYTVTLTVADNKGQTSTDTLTVFVSVPLPPDASPVAYAGVDQNATVGSVVSFNGSGSTDDVGITSYSWDFNAADGITSEATSMTATHVYASAGNYTVTLKVTDNKGQTSTDTLTVFVSVPLPPDASPVAYAGPDQNATVGSVVSFNGSGSTDDVGITSYSWDFNAADGISSEATSMTATHVYASAGNYTVTLTVTDNKGQTSTDTLTVFVSVPLPPDASPVAYAGVDQNATVGSVVSFNGSGSTDDVGITSYSWDFNAADGISSEASSMTATHVYASAGNYTVTLTVADNKGQTSTDTLTVFVSEPISSDAAIVAPGPDKNATVGSVTYSPVYDNGMRASSANSVLSATIYLDVGKSTSVCRDVMLFDLSGYNVTDTISKATLSLYWYYPVDATRTSDTVVEIYRPVEWDPKYVSWNSRTSGTLWSTTGGNWYDVTGELQGSTPYASVIFPASMIPDNKYYDFDVTRLVQEYISGTYKNTGFLLKAKTESGNYIAFYSSEYSNADMRPKLTVTTE